MTIQRVTVFGGSGFLGKYIARRYALAGWRVRVAVRRPNEALFVRTYGRVGQVEPIQANVRDEASVARAVEGADIVINVAGIASQSGKQTFDAVNVEGAGRVARLAKAAGVSQFVHISALGADAESASKYGKSMGEGEAEVKAAFPKALIVRPSIMFGVDDQFVNKIGKALSLLPVFPVVSPNAKIQPVHVDDVAQFIVAATDAGLTGVEKLAGPNVFTLRELTDFVNENVMRKRFLISLPSMFGKLQSWAGAIMQACSLGIIKSPFISPDEMKHLAGDHIVKGKSGFAKVNHSPEALKPIADRYLEIYRPHGQYAKMMRKKH